MKEKICWVQPDYEKYANAKSLRLATLLEKQGLDVKYLDFAEERLRVPEVKKEFKTLDSEFIITNLMMPRTLKIARAAKKLDKKVILYEPGLREEMKLCVKEPFFDYAVISRNEFVLPELLEKLVSGKGVSSVDGIVYEEDGEIKCNGKLGENRFDELPAIDWNLIDEIDEYLDPTIFGPAIHLQFSKGCHRNCPFCQWRHCQGGFKSKKVGETFEEIKQVLSKSDRIKCIFFEGIDFTFNRERVLELCKRFLKEDIEVNWICNARPRDLDKGILKKMKRAGCKEVMLGLESGSPKVRKRIGKNPSLESIRDAIRLCKETGLLPLLFVMLGLPGETEKDLSKTWKFTWKNKPFRVRPVFYRPVLDSPLIPIAKEYGFKEPTSFKEYLDLIYNLPYFSSKSKAKKTYRLLSLYSDIKVFFYIIKNHPLRLKVLLNQYKERIMRRIYETNELVKSLGWT